MNTFGAHSAWIGTVTSPEFPDSFTTRRSSRSRPSTVTSTVAFLTLVFTSTRAESPER
jgi:hypothetical protein